MEEILKYFVDFTDQQLAQFAQLDPFYREWNEKINLISRKDIDNLYPNHILHSLAILKCSGEIVRISSKSLFCMTKDSPGS